MDVLVLADTHLGPDHLQRMPDEVWTQAAAADLILHAGDVTDGGVIDELARCAETVVVLGNNDHSLVGTIPETVELELAGFRVAMIHDAGPTKSRLRRMTRRFPHADLVLFGHSHAPVDVVPPHGERGPRLFNPGSPTQRRRQPVHTIGLLHLDSDGIVAQHLPVGPLARSG